MAVEIQRGVRPLKVEPILSLIQDPNLDLDRYPGRAQRIERERVLGVLGAYRRYESYEPVRDDQRTGVKRWDVRSQGGWPKALRDGIYNYVVRDNGEVRIPLDPISDNEMHHHELAGEEPVIAAGELAVEGGRVKGVSNKSGHYAPDQDSLSAAAIALIHWRAPIAEDAVLITEPGS